VQQGQSLLNSYSPAAQAAGQQALALMNGQQAPALSVLQNQRSQQRAQLQQQLQQQLGPGYAESSAGIQALNNFDQDTSNTMNTAQQSAVNQYMGYAQNAGQLGAGLQQQGSQGYTTNTAMQQGQQAMQVGALTGTTVNPGLAYAGQQAMGQAVGNSFGQLAGASASMYGKLNGPAPVNVSLGYEGGKIKGKAMYKGNHPANDTVAAMLSPGEIVVPRTHATSVKKATEFVRKEIKKNKSGKPQKFKDHFQDGGTALTVPSAPIAQGLASTFAAPPQAAPAQAGQNLQFSPQEQFQRMKIRGSIGGLSNDEARTYMRYQPDGEPDLLPPGHAQNPYSDAWAIKKSRGR